MENKTSTSTSQTRQTPQPRIYVASLADYNAGRLLGRWIDASQDAPTIHAEIRTMLDESSEPIAEEWAIHDYEGFREWSPHEYESMETVAAVAALIAVHGEVAGAVMNHYGDLDEARTALNDGYRGEWESIRHYIENLVEECYRREIDALPEFIRHNIDYDGIAHDMELSGDIITFSIGRMLHVFDANI